MSVAGGSAHESDQARRHRRPLLVVAWAQLGCASLLLLCAIQALFPPVNLYYFLLLLAIMLLFCSAAALLQRRPGSWWTALLLQVPLLAYEVGVALHTVDFLRTYDPRSDLHGVGPLFALLTLLFVLPLALCSLTALLYLLRPRTRESYGLPPTSREPLQLSARTRLRLLLAVVCLGLLYFPARRIVLGYRLWETVWAEDTVTLSRLLKEGAEVDYRNSRNGWTPLIAATTNRMEGVAQVLLSAGADVNARDVWGGTPLMSAAHNGMEAVAQALLEAGADVNARDSWGHTALLLATDDGDTRIVKLLLARGANPNIRSKGGQTALESASAAGRGEIVRLLHAHGAAPSSKPKRE